MLSLAALLALWALGAAVADSDTLPPPGVVLDVVAKAAASGELFYHTGMTLWRVAASFAIALSIGIAIGVAMGASRRIDALFDPWLVFFLNIPALVVIILAYIWLGLTEVAAIAAVAINKIPNVTVTIREGVKAESRELRELAQVFEIPRGKRLRHILLPQLAPYIAAAARSGIALIWKIVLVVELLGRSDGVGFQLHLAFQFFDVAAIIAWGLTFVVVMEVIELAVMRPLQARVERWRQ